MTSAVLGVLQVTAADPTIPIVAFVVAVLLILAGLWMVFDK
jgi:hypothetical protein